MGYLQAINHSNESSSLGCYLLKFRMESTPCPTALQRILLKAESCNLYPSELSYQPVKCSFIRSADVTDITGDRLRWLCSTCFLLLFFSSMLSSAHLLMRRHAKLLLYEKSVNPTNNKLLQMPQVQRFREVTENFSGKNERFRDKSTKGFQLPRGECVPFDLANHLQGAAVIVSCVDGTLLAGVVAWS